jgi:mannosyltransferase OCH1-like enzyme
MENIDHFYYINLEKRKDLRDNINMVLNDLGVNNQKITRIEAVDKENGAYGCALSHIMALEDAKKNNYNTVVVLEDDFQLFNATNAREKMTKFFKEFDDWDLINLSCHLIAKEDCEIQNVSKILDCQSTIAYAVNNRFIDKLLNNFNESASFLSKINYEDGCQYFIDINWKKLQKENKWYTFYPILGREYPKYSDVQHKYIDHYANYMEIIKTYEDLKNYNFENDNNIPKIIFRTSKFKLQDLNEDVKKVYQNDLLNNEGYSVFYFDDEDCLQSIIDSNDDKLILAYNTLIPTAFKADLWRYYILHKYGGIYLDSSHIANIPYDEIINSEKEIFVKDSLDEYGINNSFIVCCKNNKVLQKAIELCVNNVENKRYDLRFLEITGPQLLENSYREIYNIDTNIRHINMGMTSIKHKLIDHDYSNRGKILGIMNENNEEIIKYRAIENHYSRLYNDNYNMLHYSNLFNDKLVYADEKFFSIKKLYRDLLKREADISGLIHYYKCCSLENIELTIKESEEYHKVVIKESEEYHKKVIKTYKDFKKYEFLNDGGIPKIIFRTGRYNANELPKEIVSLYRNEMENNPSYTLFYFDDKDCEEFIILEYGVITFDYYSQLIPSAFRADFWRYLILYKYGGVYIDFTMHSLVSFDEIINNYKEVYVRDTCDMCGIYNAFIAVKPNAKLIGEAIEKVKENIKNKNKGVNAIDVTGPTMFGRVFKHTLNLNFYDWIPLGDLGDGIQIYSNPSNEYIVDGDKKIIKNRIDNHYELVYNEKKHELLIDENNLIRPSQHYDRLWHDNKVFKN